MNALKSLRAAAIVAALINTHCGSDDASTAGTPNGGLGSGGAATGAGGATPGATGGYAAGTGGYTSGNGGSSAGATGGVVGNGGASTTGGTSSAGTGGGTATGGSTGPLTQGKLDPVGNQTRSPGFVDLTPPLGAPLAEQGDDVTPAAPAGWTYHGIDGAICRDGSPLGVYVHRGTVDKLLVFLEGGGACSNEKFCTFNPSNVNSILSGDGESVLGSALGAIPGRQQPGDYTPGTTAGVFETERAENPFKGWSQVYVPYCTGDVYFGTKRDAKVPGNLGPQQFVGYLNMQKIVGRVVPTFQGKVSQVAIAGSSAGGFGAVLNFSMVQDAFGNVPVSVVDDSGPPFDDAQMPVCMQKRWKEGWGFENSLPPDCTECRRADGGGFIHFADFLMRKHPKAKIAIISSMDDEVIRLFYSVGLQQCANYDVADPYAITLGQGGADVYFAASDYEAGLKGLRTSYVSTGRLSTYYMTGQKHQHLFRPRFYESPSAGVSIAQFVGDFLKDKMAQVGP